MNITPIIPRSRDYIIISPELMNPFEGRLNQCNRVLESVARAYGVDAAEVKGCVRTARLAKIRFIIYRLLTDSGYSGRKIGWVMGNRDPSTVRHGLRQFENYYVRDKFLAAVYDRHKQAMQQAADLVAEDLAA